MMKRKWIESKKQKYIKKTTSGLASYSSIYFMPLHVAANNKSEGNARKEDFICSANQPVFIYVKRVRDSFFSERLVCLCPSAKLSRVGK